MTHPDVEAWKRGHSLLGSRLVDVESLPNVTLARSGILTGGSATAWAEAEGRLAKIRAPSGFVDVIFSSGNGVAVVDDHWFEHATEREVRAVEAQRWLVEAAARPLIVPRFGLEVASGDASGIAIAVSVIVADQLLSKYPTAQRITWPDAVEGLRKLRDEPAEPTWYVVSAADPINLVGIITTGTRVPANRRRSRARGHRRCLACGRGARRPKVN